MNLNGDATRESVEAKFRELARKHHPDLGGDREKFEAIVQAREDAFKELTQAI